MITTPLSFLHKRESGKLFEIEVWPDSEITVPVPINIEITPLRFNKKHAITYEMDDTLKLIYTNVFKLFNGGLPKSDPETSIGLFFTNGFGGNIKFKGNSVGNMFFTSGTNILSWTYAGSAQLTWELLSEMYQAGWGLMGNHGSYANYSNITTEEMIYWEDRFKQEFFSRYNRCPLFAVLQGGLSNFDSAAWIDYILSTQSILLKTINSGSLPSTIDLSTLSLIEYINLYSTAMNSGRYNMDSVSKTAEMIIADIDTFMNRSGNWWFRMFSHNVDSPTNLTEYSKFKQVFKHIETTYGINGFDNVLVPSVTELIEYSVTREKAVITNVNTQSNKYELFFDFSQVPANIFNRSITMRITCDLPFKNIVSRGYKILYSGLNTNSLIVDLQSSI